MSEQEPGKMEKAKGVAKEVAGTVIRNEGMRAQGRAERQEPAEEGLTGTLLGPEMMVG